MKPHIWFSRGRWWCGIPFEGPHQFATAAMPDEALRLWFRARTSFSNAAEAA